MLVVIGGNPVYNTPADVKLTKERVEKIPFRVHVGQSIDETGELCQWHVNGKHFLEMWSDTRAFDGTVSIVQPLVSPLYDGKSAHEIVQLFAKENFEKKEMDIVKDFWKANGLADEKAWRKAVHNGFIENSALAAKNVSVSTGFLGSATNAPAGSGKYEIAILPDPSVYDGRYTNNGWLQELPNPITKITWENVALVSPKTAATLGVNQGDNNGVGGTEGTSFINTKGGNLFSDLVEVSYQGGKISQKVPVWVQPGQPDDVITVFLGYGRSRAGRVGTGLGYNAYDVQKSDAMWFGKGDVTKLGETTTIASSQTHFNLEGREDEILRTFEFDKWEEQAKATHQHDEYGQSMFPAFDYTQNKNRWGMAIDLNSCVGCNACVIACQSENNIPVVGKEQVERSREMHWMRIDAYYEGEMENPNALHFQPMLCQQCEQAPCELVCPVHATVHSAEGLNDMVYNRCIGTRYCSNNCPYKVRRFNFTLYQDWNTPQYKLMRNPEVTIRSRGVMEKCTYCTQRISAARIEAEKAGRDVRDGEIVTACEAVCPTDAIVFGNLNDPNSRVSKLHKDHRNYNVLNSLNTQPRTTYLAGLRNQNKDMPDYKPQVWVEEEAKKGENKKSEGESH
jgi:molybdopterin-containing oxidoreductase family iron-sulfur binding subunit